MDLFRGRLTRAIFAPSLLLLASCAPYEAPPLAQASLQQPAPQQDAFATIAHDLLTGMAPGQRIAIQPFRAADVPVPMTTAQNFNESLARAIERDPLPGVIVARAELPRIFAEAEEFGQQNAMKQLLAEARADVLVIGALQPVSGGVDLVYKAFDANTGRQLVAATPRFQAVDLTAARGMPVAQALASAAETLMQQAPDMNAVETLRITYQQSDVQTPLGGYIGKDLTGRLVEKLSTRQSSPNALLRPETDPDSRQGTYLLSGTVWDFGADVEVRLSLRGNGHAASTGVRIRRDAIPASLLPLAPNDALVAARNDLQLSSDRGRRPVYSVGETARLIIQTGRDGYLYCFHKSSAGAGGGVTQIFPNAFHSEAYVTARTTLHIPNENMKFVLDVQGPPGTEQVRCFVTDHDVAAALPTGRKAGGLQPINVDALDDLSLLLRNVSAAAVTEATMVMTIAPK